MRGLYTSEARIDSTLQKNNNALLLTKQLTLYFEHVISVSGEERHMNTTLTIGMYVLGGLVLGLGVATALLCLRLRDARRTVENLDEEILELRNLARAGIARAVEVAVGSDFVVHHSPDGSEDYISVDTRSDGKSALQVIIWLRVDFLLDDCHNRHRRISLYYGDKQWESLLSDPDRVLSALSGGISLLAAKRV
jgi:hypothetical protein